VGRRVSGSSVDAAPSSADHDELFVFERSARFGQPSTLIQVFAAVTNLARNTEQTRFVRLAQSIAK
jgi:hypothetical protein